MLPHAHPAIHDTRREATTQQYAAWLLAALVVLFCANARLGSYKQLHRSTRPANTRAYFDSEETRLGTPLAALLLLWWTARAKDVRPIAATPSPIISASNSAAPLGGFEREFRIRPPPRP
jgi:hypothetical protein